MTIAALVREAVDGALADAELTFGDIDAIVLAKTPDLFDGVMNPELYLADAIGARGLPVTRVFTGGSVGGHAAIYAAHLIQARLAGRVLVVAYSKESEGNFTWALSRPLPFSAQLGAGAGGHFAPVIREYIRRSHAPEHIGWQVAVNHRLNATRNPYAHIHKPDITIEEVRSSPMLWDPIRFLESCPSSDGSCAVVISSEMHARLAPRPPAWIHGTGWRTETGHFAGRDEVNPRADRSAPPPRIARRASPIPAPKWMSPSSTFPTAGTSRCGWRTSVWHRRVRAGAPLMRATPHSGPAPDQPVRRVLSGNPTGATGLPDSPRPHCRCGGSRVNTRSMAPGVR